MSKDRSEAVQMPATEPNRTPQAATSSRADIDAFLGQVGALGPVVKAGERGRLIFALDATMSRQPTWDQACQLQSEMFREAASVGGLDLQLVYYRGLAECRASGWVAEPERFGEMISAIDSVAAPGNSACAAFRHSCFRRVTTRCANKPFERLHGCRAAPIAGSRRA